LPSNSSFFDLFHTILKSVYEFNDKFKKAIGSQPSLDYVEFHLADHCNLNCRGCGHFSPIADETFASLTKYRLDLLRLKEFFSNLKMIVLMGGEPLLNPQIEDFLSLTRQIFPKSNIQLFTNGILLPNMPTTFWSTCRACSITIDISLYPPVVKKEATIINIVKSNGIKLQTHRVINFHAFYNKKGDTDAKKAFRKCRLRWYTPMLREGKLFICPKAATINYFVKKFGLDIPRTGFIDIHSGDISGWDVKERLNEAASVCNYCTLGWDTIPTFPWTFSKRVLADWVP
jgi:organic radical activating enzyme